MTTIDVHSPAPAQIAPVRRFSELSRDDLDYAGGKGANLGELTQAGFPVPRLLRAIAAGELRTLPERREPTAGKPPSRSFGA